MSFESWASKRVVKVCVFGNGISVSEWAQLMTSPWRHYGGFVVKLVDDPSIADVLAIHGPITTMSRPFLKRWASLRSEQSKVLWVGPEVDSRHAELSADLVLVGSPPAPAILKAGVEQVLWGKHHV